MSIGTFREYLNENSNIVINATKEGLYDIEIEILKSDKSLEKFSIKTDKELNGLELGLRLASKFLGCKEIKINRIGFR